ncbi:MAG: hypothetical protein ACR2IB_09450 [Pyrinomonadaceae bacterium]
MRFREASWIVTVFSLRREIKSLDDAGEWYLGRLIHLPHMIGIVGFEQAHAVGSYC